MNQIEQRVPVAVAQQLKMAAVHAMAGNQWLRPYPTLGPGSVARPDLPSLRHTTGSLLAASGVHPNVAQSLM